MSDLEYTVEKVNMLSVDIIGDMFTLYDRYYAGTSEQLFRHDLAEKQYVIVLRDIGGRLLGFSTQMVMEHRFEGAPIRTIYSGDTIVDHQYWGQQETALCWLQLTGYIKAEQPETPLYWFLLVKGHRTYRLLRVFFSVFYPAHDRETPPQDKALMDMLARDRFGDAYDVDRGIISFTTSHGHLKSSWADIPEKDRNRPDVAFFLERNPGYTKGEELMCLAELSLTNLRPMAERQFRKGMDNGI